jgi:hypothetical protein
MIDLEASARALNEQSITPRLPVDVVLARGRRIRLRRRLAIIAITCSVAVAGIATSELLSSDTSKHLIVTGHTTGSPPTTTATLPAPPLVAPPKLLIAHEEQGGSAPGRIVVIDTATGRTIRVLGADYDPYLQNGFAIARETALALWTRLNQAPRAPIESVEVPIIGGPEHVLAPTGGPGPFLSVNSDGTQLWSGTTIVDLTTGHRTIIPRPPSSQSPLWHDASWLPDGHRLFLVEGHVDNSSCESGPQGPVPPSCLTTTTIGTHGTRGLVYDLNDPRAGWRVTASPDRAEGWWDLQILGPGRLPATIVASGRRGPSSTNSAPAIMTINVDTGAITDAIALPADANVLAVDQSGTNILFTTSRQLERLSIADPTPIIIGKRVAEAAW